MSERIWDRFLTDQDKAHLQGTTPRKPFGFGERPALLMIDNYRAVIGDEPQPLLEAVRDWPSSTGLAGWAALERIEKLLAAVRAVDLPIIHITGLNEEESGVAPWSALRELGPGKQLTPEQQDRHARRHDFVPQAAPIEGEIILRKAAPSSFYGTPLVAHLNALRIDTLIVAGESTSGCVRASVVDGVTNRYHMIVVEDCVYDRHEAAHAINLFDMNRKYADVLPLEDVLAWLDEYASLRRR